eukprot:4845-Pyramimonas_sp.AAC.1
MRSEHAILTPRGQDAPLISGDALLARNTAETTRDQGRCRQERSARSRRRSSREPGQRSHLRARPR